jgi:hypothetical protein
VFSRRGIGGPAVRESDKEVLLAMRDLERARCASREQADVAVDRDGAVDNRASAPPTAFTSGGGCSRARPHAPQRCRQLSAVGLPDADPDPEPNI